MKRIFRLGLLALIIATLGSSLGIAQKPQAFVSGRIAASDVRIFVSDTLYIINNEYVVGGALIIEPGTEVNFYNNGRIIDSTGGRIIADGAAEVAYKALPQNYDPKATGNRNPYGWTGYADLNYFNFNGEHFLDPAGNPNDPTIAVNTLRDVTVNASKAHYIYNVVLDKNARTIKNLHLNSAGQPRMMDAAGNLLPLTPGVHEIISFEKAIMLVTSRLIGDSWSKDPNIDLNPWRRVGNKPASFSKAPIIFRGTPDNNFSREWGHTIVLPGARAAFFRNVRFEEFKKDTTVDRKNYYAVNQSVGSVAQWTELNRRIQALTNGAGGALTTLSSRTWLIDVSFTNNEARYRGGALQILEAPAGYPTSFTSLDNLRGTIAARVGGNGNYPMMKNPQITDVDGSSSAIIENKRVPQLDMVDEPGVLEPLSDWERAAFDDARLAVYLGRVRNLRFENNRTILANVIEKTIPGTPLRVVDWDTENPARFPQMNNHSYGGAIYIAGYDASENRQIEIGLGINNAINVDLNGDGIYTDNERLPFAHADFFFANNNVAFNYQTSGSSLGARGGAIYSGKYTSLIVAGDFRENRADAALAKFDSNGEKVGIAYGSLSMGGAIYQENTLGRLQVRGNPSRDNIATSAGTTIANPTRFVSNRAGNGAALFVDGNSDPSMSPYIGGSDATINTRDLGFNIVFENNVADVFGGAVYTKRHMMLNGAGGVEANEMLGYGGNYPVRFVNNKADYAGGAFSIIIPNADFLNPNQKNIYMARAVFEGNEVGMEVQGIHKADIRGGGAIYILGGDLNVVKGTEFTGNKVLNGNGGAVAMIAPDPNSKRFFISDLDMVMDTNMDGIYDMYESNDAAFNYFSEQLFPGDPNAVRYPADVRMQTRFLGNEVTLDQDEDFVNSQMGRGTTQIAAGTDVTRNALYSTHWVDNNSGYAVGLRGEIVFFKDGGDTWLYQTNNVQGGRLNTRLNKVHFTSSTVGYAIGDQGVMIRTTDAGATWTRVNFGTFVDFNDMFFVNSTTAYMAADNGMIYRTTDGWNTWTSSQPEVVNLNSVFFTSSTRGFVVGDRKALLRTNDAGMTWESVLVPIPNYRLNAVNFLSANRGYIVGESGVFLTTTNGGDEWNQVNTGYNDNMTAVHFTNQNNGFMVSGFGKIYKTTDGAVTWEIDNNTTSFGLYSISFPSSTVGYVSGDFGLILKTTDAGATWSQVLPADASVIDVVRYHKGINLPENGIGLGGAIYILDEQTSSRVGRTDSVRFNRVRMQRNSSYTGAAVYSDNFDLKLIFNRSLIANNWVNSSVGATQNAITGPVGRDANGDINLNKASNDLTGAIIYGEIQGPLPSYMYHESANAIFNNDARFLIRLPDAPHTKGILAGTLGIGSGGTDTLRGNFWGRTEANVNIRLNRIGVPTTVQETFFVAGNGTNPLPYVYGKENDPDNPLLQGPFESLNHFTYRAIMHGNDMDDEDVQAENSILDTLLMAGKIYDLYDKGTDIKTADYSARRMAPIEDFAIGLPPVLRYFDDATMPSFNKYVKRMTRDPFCVDRADLYPTLALMQDEFRRNKDGEEVHPIGYPLYLESNANYDGIIERSNHDPHTLNQTVFFVINETTGDYIRTTMNQVSEDAPFREVYRARVDLVPDSSGNRAILARRTTDGIANFGNNTRILLENLFRQADNEDKGTLEGRKYVTNYTGLGNATDLFSNRPAFGSGISSVDTLQNGQVTYFAGERYGALPVNVGDQVRVVSRTILWKDGVNPAYDGSMSFRVTRSTEVPQFTGDVVRLQMDTVTQIVSSEFPDRQFNRQKDTLKLTEFLHTIYLTEDRVYPQPEGTYSTLKTREYPDANQFGDELAGGTGRDYIMNLTAVDSNNFYDPRALANPNTFTNLQYRVNLGGTSLRHWLTIDTVFANETLNDANGYLMFKGKPVNPFVVPGGENLVVESYNFPPNFRTYDQIMNSDLFTQEEKDKFIEKFRPYYNAEAYAGPDTARYLQQDTINVGLFNRAQYSMRIIVVDSVPRFLGPNEQREEVLRFRPNSTEVLDTLVVYEPSVYACDPDDQDRLVANLTDKLRFQVNINTDDELEDQWARKNHNWDFRYGQTAYGFLNVVRNGGTYEDPEDVIVDITEVDNDEWQREQYLNQIRPSWMSNQYLYRYDSDDTVDEFGQDLISRGEINIRIPEDEAYPLLRMKENPNDVNVNRPLNLDTNFTIVVNDGHGGRAERNFKVFINVKPTIQANALANAVEGQDYNRGLLDSARRIFVYDPNFGQHQKYELIYAGDTRDEVAKDPCFEEAGVWDLRDKKTTPNWLKINEQTGLLYGKPGIKDAPATEVVWVLVTDSDGLTDLREFSIVVEPRDHSPRITSVPTTRCFDAGQQFVDTLVATDYDMLRDPARNRNETLTFTVVRPAVGFRVEPTTVTGDGTTDTVFVRLIADNPGAIVRDADGKVRVVVRVTDSNGESDEIEHVINVSDETRFVANIRVSNQRGAFQLMQWGVADDNVTTGDNTDGNPFGSIDRNYCEYELPPLPQADVFDTRWTVPSINGVLRSIYPYNTTANQIYIAQVQPGGENGQTSPMYPVRIEWDMTEVPGVGDAKNPLSSVWYLRDAYTQGQQFHINMSTGDAIISSGYAGEIQGNRYVLTVTNSSFDAFVIWRDWNNSVEDMDYTISTGIKSVSPNPASTHATIHFDVNRSERIVIEVIDILGNIVNRIVDADYAPGSYQLEWMTNNSNNTAIANGNYQIRMVAGGEVSVAPIVIVK